MAIKKYSSGSWVTVPYKKYETATGTITSLPKTIYGDGQNISAYTIKGNMSQTGTPTPTSPIYPSECGDLISSGEHSGEYEIPFSMGGVTYSIYLAEPLRKASDNSYYDILASDGTLTRNLRKIVLTGTENVELVQQTGYVQFKLQTSYYKRPAYTVCTWWCSHYNAIPNSGDWSGGDNYITISQGDSPDRYYRFKDTRFSTAEDFKTFIATQYANGSPVTIWQVSASATTDSFTAPTIPTTGTAEQFDIDTTLSPSEVQLTYHGWHEHEDTKYT